jgi:hypothetical protein
LFSFLPAKGSTVAKAYWKVPAPHFIAALVFLATTAGGSSSAQQLANTEGQAVQANPKSQSPTRRPQLTATVTATEPVQAANPKIARKPQSGPGSRGPYYVDFRARTAASYGHAFVWFGKISEKKVEVAGLHPAGDVLPYVLGHLMWVPSETGASYGDLDVQYLTASYRVYLNERDAAKVFAHIKHLQATSPLWNAETTNCTAFIGQIASYMGLKVPFHIKRPEEYVKELKSMNGGRQTAQLSPEQ